MMYCVEIPDDNGPRYLGYKSRGYESDYAPQSDYIKYARVRDDKEKLTAELKKLKKKYPECLAEARVRELTQKEKAEYEEAQKSNAKHRDYCNRRSNVSVQLSQDGEEITIFTKKNINGADRAFLDLFTALGAKVRMNEYGFRFMVIKRPHR